MAGETFSPREHRYMGRALELARRGWYSTQPNPRVGCVVVKNDEIVGEGFHEKAGRAHAEVNALNMAGEKARGATVFVTLEPCSHSGRTPPCCEKLIAAGVARVVYATGDVNPQVAGRGAEILREAGIAVSGGLLAVPARDINRGFFKRHEQGRPYVTIKLAISLDAKIGLKSGESKWITGADARMDVQRLRAQSCAIVTGSGTVRADNPRLTVRDPSLPTLGRQPRVVVVDSRLSLDSTYAIFHTDADCIIMHCAGTDNQMARMAEHHIVTQRVSGRVGQVDLAEVLAYLAKQECNEVLIEAGPSLASAFIETALWDELVVYVAPKLIGSSGRDGFSLAGISDLSSTTDLKINEVRRVGDDLRMTFTPGSSCEAQA